MPQKKQIRKAAKRKKTREKKPDASELTDEDLDEVAGGIIDTNTRGIIDTNT